VHRLLPFFPELKQSDRYHEPFAGAANLFFALEPKKANLSDLNKPLIECYKEIRDSPATVAKYLRGHERRNSEKYYYEIRAQYNRSRAGPAQSARFIYLNRTCFNGVFRVNREGDFNVPFGDKENPTFPSSKELSSLSSALKYTRLFAADFDKSLSKTKKGDFVYLDPPYPPLNGTSYFTHYTADRFDADNQTRLAKVVKDLDRRGIRFLMTNADHPRIRELYRKFELSKLSVTRFVSCKGSRHKVGELVITNYKLRGEGKKKKRTK